ncbi:MAG: hypothetical protein PHW03_05275 [Eubacteriales bacterium]|nr:hypothetical protein [Eubacteriales bacterium]
MSDLASLYIKVDSTGVVTASRDLSNFEGVAQKTEGATRKVETATQSANSQFTQMANIVKAVAASYAVLKMAQYIQDATMLAARYETLGVVMRTVGNNSGYTSAEMEKFAKGLEKTGISMVAARETIVKMTQAHLDLTKSEQLARVAQDAAVIGNINSSEAFQRMIYGIQSGQIEVLRTIGINVNFENSYKKVAASLGKTADQLTETEKTQIRMNVVMDAGKTIAGTYESAMETAGKQVLSLDRHLENLKVMFGQAFTPALAVLIGSITDAVTGLNGELSGEGRAAITAWGKEFASNVSTVISAIKSMSAPVVAVIETLWKLRDVLIAIGIAFAAVKIDAFITGLSVMSPALTSLITTLALARVAVQAFLLSLGPIGLVLAGVGVALTAAYSAYELFGNGNDDAVRKMTAFEQKAKEMDLTNVESQIDWLSLKLKNFAKDKEGFFGINIFGSTPKDEYSEDQLKNMIRYLQDQREILVTEKNLATIRKEHGEINAKNAADEAKAAESAKKSASERLSAEKSIVEATRKAQIEIDGYGQSTYEKDLVRIASEEQKWRDAKASDVKIAQWKAAEITLAEQKMNEETTKEAQKDFDDYLKREKEKVDKAKSTVAERLKAERDLYKDLRGYEGYFYEESITLINAQAETWRKILVNKASTAEEAAKHEAAIAAWVAEETRKQEIKKLEYSNKFFDGVKAGYLKMEKDALTFAKAGEKIFESFNKESQKLFSDGLFDAIKTGTVDSSKLFTNFSDAMLRKFTDIVAQMVVEAATKSIVMSFSASWTDAATAVLGVIGKLLGYASDWFSTGTSSSSALNLGASTSTISGNSTGTYFTSSYAQGGQHSGGWRIVGEEGPELEYTGPSQIFTNSNTSKILAAIAAQGQNGDTMLAHVNPAEARLLRSMGGAGTINERTGLRQFFNTWDEIGHGWKSTATETEKQLYRIQYGSGDDGKSWEIVHPDTRYAPPWAITNQNYLGVGIKEIWSDNNNPYTGNIGYWGWDDLTDAYYKPGDPFNFFRHLRPGEIREDSDGNFFDTITNTVSDFINSINESIGPMVPGAIMGALTYYAGGVGALAAGLSAGTSAAVAGGIGGAFSNVPAAGRSGSLLPILIGAGTGAATSGISSYLGVNQFANTLEAGQITADMQAQAALNEAITSGATDATAQSIYSSVYSAAMDAVYEQAAINIVSSIGTGLAKSWAMDQVMRLMSPSYKSGQLQIGLEGFSGGGDLASMLKSFPSNMSGSVAFSAADGGVFSGPETGYSGLLHGTEAVIPLEDGRSVPVTINSDSSELLTEIKGLRADIKAVGLAEVKNTGKMAKILNLITSGSIDADGYPAMRTATA